ncbi:Hypothetical protein CINCED_3A024558 [Cinara cedri]|uniref:Uncharacterized protein n=1 Tax=Cinara cedri TaxID=506608 RepID=A0A5E4MSR0_9HEMI|nr:Hypothetical protein CINCED_3A024558 [Cinara cedri]
MKATTARSMELRPHCHVCKTPGVKTSFITVPVRGISYDVAHSEDYAELAGQYKSIQFNINYLFEEEEEEKKGEIWGVRDVGTPEVKLLLSPHPNGEIEMKATTARSMELRPHCHVCKTPGVKTSFITVPVRGISYDVAHSEDYAELAGQYKYIQFNINYLFEEEEEEKKGEIWVFFKGVRDVGTPEVILLLTPHPNGEIEMKATTARSMELRPHCHVCKTPGVKTSFITVPVRGISYDVAHSEDYAELAGQYKSIQFNINYLFEEEEEEKKGEIWVFFKVQTLCHSK